MENKRNIYKIKSKYVLKNIFNFIEDKNVELKLFPYSKLFQKKLYINYSYCYKRYLEEINFDIKRYSYKKGYRSSNNILRDEYNSFITKNNLNKEKFENIIYEVINNQKQKEEDNYISFDSPLFELILKTKDFTNNYTIYISQKNIDDFSLKSQYIKIFNKLNKSDIKYSSICFIYYEIAKLDYLRELKINFDNISKLRLEYLHDVYPENPHHYKNDLLNLFHNLEQLIIRGDDNIMKILENANLKELKVLNIYKISNTNIFDTVNFKKLETLNLSDNMIQDINFLKILL